MISFCHGRLTGVVALFAAPLFLIVRASEHPFPQERAYAFVPEIVAGKSHEVQRFYEEWKADYYEEQGDLARIKFRPAEDTVSEGIAYGMLIFVYMENEHNQTRDPFDKLYNYYKKFRNKNQLMHWRIRGFEEVVGENSATDAELDVALALLLAYRQWNDKYYLREAKKVIRLIYKHQVNERGHLKPGDMWDREKNPCYLTIAAFELFKEVDKRNDWQEVIDNAYQLLKASSHPETGLTPDWCSEEGVPSPGDRGRFWYDAVRVPWRLAWTYSWFGDERSMALLRKNNRWVESIGGLDQVMAGYQLDGTPVAKNKNVCFTGTFATSVFVDPDSSISSEEAYKATVEARAPHYYHKSLRLLYLLLITGNCHNFLD